MNRSLPVSFLVICLGLVSYNRFSATQNQDSALNGLDRPASSQDIQAVQDESRQSHVEFQTQSSSPTDKIQETVIPVPEQTDSSPCNRAVAGNPFDITIEDSSAVPAGSALTKTWRLINAGSCIWTREYAVVWVYGSDMGSNHIVYIKDPVSPGNSIDLSIDIIAPQQPGEYQSQWMLRDPSGDLFGIGPKGQSPFWISIEVFGNKTPTK